MTTREKNTPYKYQLSKVTHMLPFLLLVFVTPLAAEARLIDYLQNKQREEGGAILSTDAKRYFSDGVNTINKVRAPFREGEVLVRFSGDEERFRVLSLPAGETVEQAISRLAARSDVLYVEPNYLAFALGTPNDPQYPLQWNLHDLQEGGMNAITAWETATGKNVVVAVVDTGVAYESARHGNRQYIQAPDLSSTCFVVGYDFVNNDAWPNDDHGHGTHVAGTIAQSTNNNMGVAGVAYDSCILPVKVLDSDGSGTHADIARGIYYAVREGADVINLSLGSYADSITIRTAVRFAYNQGVVVVAAAGNDNTSEPSYPAAYDEYVISVGATGFDTIRASYSNYGSTVDIVAPGGDFEDLNGDGYEDGILQQTFAGIGTRQFTYAWYQGTSMAAPHVAGAAALLLEHAPALTPDEVRTALTSSAHDLGPQGRDAETGHGLLDAGAALSRVEVNTDGTAQVVSTRTQEQQTKSAGSHNSKSDVQQQSWPVRTFQSFKRTIALWFSKE